MPLDGRTGAEGRATDRHSSDPPFNRQTDQRNPIEKRPRHPNEKMLQRDDSVPCLSKKFWLNHNIGFLVFPPLLSFLYPIPLVSGSGQSQRLGGRALWLEQARGPSAAARGGDRGTQMKGGGGGPEIQYWENSKIFNDANRPNRKFGPMIQFTFFYRFFSHCFL